MVHGKKKKSYKSAIIILLLLLPIKKKKKKEEADLYRMYLLQMICLNMLGDHINML